MSNTIISVKNCCKRFPGVQALRNVNFDLREGEVHALLGENGAGKSSLIKVILGVHPKDSGQICYADQELSLNNPQQAVSMGICAIYQELSLIPALDIACNLHLGRFPLKKNGLVDWQKIYANASKVLEDLQLKLDPHTLIKDLTATQRQLVEIGRALSFNSKVIIMDEPTSSLSSEEVKELFNKIRILKQKKVSIIYITHKLDEVFKIGDRVTVLRDGEVVSTRDIKDVDIDSIIKEMIGHELASAYPKNKVPIGEVALEINNLSRGNVVNDCSFFVRKGEILGLAGLVGSGRTEIVRAIFGIDQPDSGEIKLEGKSIRIKKAQDAIKHGIAMLPEERKTQGIIGLQSIWCNICFAAINCRRTASFYHHPIGTLIKSRMVTAAEKYHKLLDIRSESLNREVRNLSGGNQQKVVLARSLNIEPKVVILDEPTKGIDVAAKAEVFKIIGDLVATGVAVILISSEHQEVLKVSDRILVINQGRIVGELDPQVATEEDILRLSVV